MAIPQIFVNRTMENGNEQTLVAIFLDYNRTIPACMQATEHESMVSDMKHSLAEHASIAKVIGIGDVINDANKENSKLRAYFRFDDLEGKTTFSCETLPLKHLMTLIPSAPYNFKIPITKSGCAWVDLDPQTITSHRNLLPQDSSYILDQLHKQHMLSSAQPSAQREHAYFLHENHLRAELDLYTLIIPCATIIQHYFCSSARLASIVLTSQFANDLKQYELTNRDHYSQNKPYNTCGAYALSRALSTPTFRASALLPYKHILMTAIANLRKHTPTPLSILTSFPEETATSLLISYQAFEQGIKDHFKKRIVVVKQIRQSYPTAKKPGFTGHPQLLTPRWAERQP